MFVLDLTPEQQKILIDIRRRKTELLLEIQVSKQIDIDNILSMIKISVAKTSYIFLNTIEAVSTNVFNCNLLIL